MRGPIKLISFHLPDQKVTLTITHMDISNIEDADDCLHLYLEVSHYKKLQFFFKGVDYQNVFAKLQEQQIK